MRYQYLAEVVGISGNDKRKNAALRIIAELVDDSEDEIASIPQFDGDLIGKEAHWIKVDDKWLVPGQKYSLNVKGANQSAELLLVQDASAVFEIVEVSGTQLALRESILQFTADSEFPRVFRANQDVFFGPVSFEQSGRDFAISGLHREDANNQSRGLRVGERLIEVNGAIHVPEKALLFDRRMAIDLREGSVVTLAALGKLSRSSKSRRTWSSKEIENLVEYTKVRTGDAHDAFQFEFARSYLSNWSLAESNAEKLLVDVLKHPDVTWQIEQRVDTKVQEELDRVEDLTKQKLQDAEVQSQHLIDNAKFKVEELNRESERLAQQIEQQKLAVDGLIGQVQLGVVAISDALGSAFETRLDSLREHLRETLEDAIVINVTPAAPPPSPVSQLEVPQIAENTNNPCRIIDLGFDPIAEVEVRDSREALESDLSRGLGSTEAAVAMQALLARRVPVVIGPGSSRVARCLADKLAGGRGLSVCIEPGLVSPRNVFIKEHSDGAIQVSTNRVLDFFLSANEHPDRFFLLILESINHSAIETYLLPILQLYAGDRTHIPLFRPDELEKDNPFYQFVSLAWPPNVLLAATAMNPGDDVVALEVPPFAWEYMVPILDTGKRSAKAHELSEVTASTWAGFVEQTNAESGKVVRHWRVELSDHGLPKELEWSLDRVAGYTDDVSGAVNLLLRYFRFGGGSAEFEHFVNEVSDSDDWNPDVHTGLLKAFRSLRWPAHSSS